jgi:hypothetical protein
MHAQLLGALQGSVRNKERNFFQHYFPCSGGLKKLTRPGPVMLPFSDLNVVSVLVTEAVMLQCSGMKDFLAYTRGRGPCGPGPGSAPVPMGDRCTDLMSVYYQKHFHEDLEEVRRNWGILPCRAPKREQHI